MNGFDSCIGFTVVCLSVLMLTLLPHIAIYVMNRLSRGGSAARQGRPSSKGFIASRPASQSNEALDSANDVQHGAAAEVPARRFKPPRPASSLQTPEQLNEEQPAFKVTTVSGIKLQPYKKPRLQPSVPDAAVSSELLQLSPLPTVAVSRFAQPATPTTCTPTSPTTQQFDSGFSLFKVAPKTKLSLQSRDSAAYVKQASKPYALQNAKELTRNMVNMSNSLTDTPVSPASTPTRVAHDRLCKQDGVKQAVGRRQGKELFQDNADADCCGLAMKQTFNCDKLPGAAALVKPDDPAMKDLKNNDPQARPGSELESTPTSEPLAESGNDIICELEIPALPTNHTYNKAAVGLHDIWATLNAAVKDSALPDTSPTFQPELSSMHTVVSLLRPNLGLPLPSLPPDIQTMLTSRVMALVQQLLVSAETDVKTTPPPLLHRPLLPYTNPVANYITKASATGSQHHTIALDAVQPAKPRAGADDEDVIAVTSTDVQVADANTNPTQKQHAVDMFKPSTASGVKLCAHFHDVLSGQDAEFLAISQSAELQLAELLRPPVDARRSTISCNATYFHNNSGIDWGHLLQMCQ